MPWYYIPCKYQKHVKEQEGRIRHLEKELKAATRIQNSSSTAIDNIFIDSTRLSFSCKSSVVSGFSDHDVQFLIVNNITIKVSLISLKEKTRKINNETIAQFRHLLENETWEPVFKNKDTNYKFFIYLSKYL
jgi:hypothetical protein